MTDGQALAGKTVDWEKIVIRAMHQEDLEQVAELEKSIFSEPWSREGFALSLASKDTLYFVAVCEERIVGYCGLLRSFEEADITNVAVDVKEAELVYNAALMATGKIGQHSLMDYI